MIENATFYLTPELTKVREKVIHSSGEEKFAAEDILRRYEELTQSEERINKDILYRLAQDVVGFDAQDCRFERSEEYRRVKDDLYEQRGMQEKKIEENKKRALDDLTAEKTMWDKFSPWATRGIAALVGYFGTKLAVAGGGKVVSDIEDLPVMTALAAVGAIEGGLRISRNRAQRRITNNYYKQMQELEKEFSEGTSNIDSWLSEQKRKIYLRSDEKLRKVYEICYGLEAAKNLPPQSAVEFDEAALHKHRVEDEAPEAAALKKVRPEDISARARAIREDLKRGK